MARAHRRRRERRPWRDWALRGVAAVVAALIGYISSSQTLAFAIRKADPDRAYRLSPHDGRIAAELAERLTVKAVTSGQQGRVEPIARQALMDEPLAASALTALGLAAQARGDTVRARQLFAHSDTLSRRELGPQLWLIEDAVARGDVAGALRHYDIALRTARAAPDLLFPILSSAISDPAIAQSLARTLLARPAWGNAFIDSLGTAKADPKVAATFLRRLMRDGYPVSEGAQVGVVNGLVASGATNEGWSFYASLRRGADRRRSRDPAFTAQLQMPSAFDWAPVASDGGVSASLQRAGGGGGLFDFSAPSTVGGVVLQQAQFLPAGRYWLEGISAGIEQPSGSRPYWQLTCEDGREAGRVELPNSAERNGRFAGGIDVAGGCSVQTLRLVVRPSSDVGGVTGQIVRVALRPLSQEP